MPATLYKSLNFLLVILLACTSQFVSAAPTKLVFVYMENYAPFSFLDEDGQVVGIQPEIVDALAQRLGVQVEHRLYPWARAQAMVRSGEADAMLTTPTSERFEFAVFAKEETSPNLWNIFIRKKDRKLAESIPAFNSLEDLKSYRLIDFLGNGWSKTFMKEEDGFTNTLLVNDPGNIPRLLLYERGDLVISSSAVFNYHSHRLGIADHFQEFDIEWNFTRFHQVIQLSRKSAWLDTGLIKGLDDATREIKADGTYRNILRKYHSRVGAGYPFTSQLDAAYLESKGFYEGYRDLPEFSLKPLAE